MEYVAGLDGAELKLPLKFPVELRKPEGFDPDRPATWPEVIGRVEYIGGRLLYMPPCGDVQARVAIDAAVVLRGWAKKNPDFVVLGNEAGMKLGSDVRGADVAVWRRAGLGRARRGFPRVPPVMVLEVEGADEDEQALRQKARWYFEHGVARVWIVLPSRREVLVLSPRAQSTHRRGERIAPSEDLPGLEPLVDELFEQLELAPD